MEYRRWAKTLDLLKYDGLLNKYDREKEVVFEFQNFRRKWEMLCKEHNFKYELVSDEKFMTDGI